MRVSTRTTAGQDALAALALVALPFALLGRGLLPGKVLSPADNLLLLHPWHALAPGVVPANGLLGDVTMLFHPWLIYAGQEIGQGRFPLWNPHSFAGVPFFANPQTALLFPLTTLAYVFPAPLALGLIPILKLAAAGGAMYWFLRIVSIGPPAASLAAVTFMLNGSLAAWLQWSNSTPGVVLPLLFALTERLRQYAGGRAIAWLAAAVAIDVLAGYPQGTALGLVSVTAWAILRARGAPGGAPWFVGRYAGAVALGLGLAAVQLVPFLEYLQESSVFASRELWMPALSLPARSAITFLMPYYYGSPITRDFWGPWNFNETAVSVGLVPWVVLPLAVAAARRDARARFFLVMAATGAAILYEVPGADAVRSVLPGLSLVIGQRFAPLVVFALAAASAFGLQALLGAEPPGGRMASAMVKATFVALATIAFLSVASDFAAFSREPLRVPVPAQYVWCLSLLGIATIVVLACLRGGEAPARAWLALALVQLASLLPVAASHNPVVDAQWLYPASPSLQHVRRESARDQGRVLLHPNVSMLYGLSEAGGYDGMTPARVEHVVGPQRSLTLSASDGIANPTVFASPTLDLLGVRRIVVRPDLTLEDDRFALEYSGPDARVYLNRQALDRVFLVSRGRCVTDGEAVELVWKRAVDFRREVLLAGCDAAEPAAPGGRVARVELRSYEADRIVVHAATDAPAYLVLTDTWFPGWRARVDGVETRVWRANHAFRAVRLDPGEHEVVFSYEPGSVRLGRWLSLAAACATAAMAFALRGSAVTAGCVTLALVLGLGSGGAEAGLPRPPFGFRAAPSTVTEGEAIELRVEPRPSPGGERHGFDLYVVVYVGWDVDSFVGPDGTRSIDGVPFRRGLSTSDLAPVVVRWRDPAPAGTLLLVGLAVKAGTSPYIRSNWLYEPKVESVRVAPALQQGRERRHAVIVLASLALPTLAAALLVLVYPGRAGDHQGGGRHPTTRNSG